MVFLIWFSNILNLEVVTVTVVFVEVITKITNNMFKDKNISNTSKTPNSKNTSNKWPLPFSKNTTNDKTSKKSYKPSAKNKSINVSAPKLSKYPLLKFSNRPEKWFYRPIYHVNINVCFPSSRVWQISKIKIFTVKSIKT